MDCKYEHLFLNNVCPLLKKGKKIHAIVCRFTGGPHAEYADSAEFLFLFNSNLANKLILGLRSLRSLREALLHGYNASMAGSRDGGSPRVKCYG